MHFESDRAREERNGRRFWRGLEEIASTPAFQEMLERDFPGEAASWLDPITRRQFLTILGASLALAGVNGCSPKPAPAEKIMPYVRQPVGLTLGQPRFYATAMVLHGVATGVLVTSREGRPVKVEGNPSHPASLGASDVFAQASVLSLYDPDRSQSITYRGRARGWDETLAALRRQRERLRPHGDGLFILTEPVTSPTLGSQVEALQNEFPASRWYQWDPAAGDGARAGSLQAFGRPINTFYDLTHADIILSLDSDFLSCGPAHLRYARDFASRRVAELRNDHGASMNRLYVAESMLTPTGAKADHRLRVRAAEVEDLARALAHELRIPGAPAAGSVEPHRRWLGAVAEDLSRHHSNCAVLAGETQPAAVHALAQALNHALGNFGKTVFHTEAIEARPTDQIAGLQELVRAMSESRVLMLLMLGVNPVLTAPADLEFERRLANVPFRLHSGLYQDETAAYCDWHVPEAHYLESWGDVRAHEGTASIIQPLIAPLYGGRTALEILTSLTNQPERRSLEIVREHWRSYRHARGVDGDFETFWHQALEEGIVPDTKFPLLALTPQTGWAGKAAFGKGAPAGEPSMEIVFRADPTLLDGRFANNGWLQELPKPITKLCWGNAAFVSPQTAEKLGVRYGHGSDPPSGNLGQNAGEHGQAVVDVVELTYSGHSLRAPVWIVPGHADDSVTVHLGHGRSRAGRVGNDIGFDIYPMRRSTAPWFDSGLKVHRTNDRAYLACTQMHHSMEAREPVRSAPLARYRQNPKFAHHLTAAQEEQAEVLAMVPGATEPAPSTDRRLRPLTLYAEYDYSAPKYRWGMSIDLTACVGCSACVVACQAENNIPVVGMDQVMRGREMHWLRIDRYFSGSVHDPLTHFQPVPCMHCEKAPCELVCPVGATVHSSDGLNDMVYNRCVGTRYCSNNCPYKVRRFNFLDYADYATPVLKLQRNPEVTVRSRGVMEKCTYCVQRLRTADIDAEKAGRRVRDGEVITACQQACPAQAIVFGDINDLGSRVAAAKNQPRDYALLQELGTQPRTTYLAEVRNPNPKLD